MATGTLGSSARDYHTRQLCYLSAPITFSNLAPTQSFKIGTLPAGSFVAGAGVGISTAFNAGTNNNFSIGNASGGAQIVSGQAGLATLGWSNVPTVASAACCPAVDTDVYVTGALTGTSASAGAGVVYLEYIIPG